VLILRLQDRGVAVATIPLIWAGLHVVRSGSSYPGGWLSDHLGPRNAVAAGGALFALVAASLALELSPVVAVSAFLALGLVAGLTESAERALVARLAPVRTGRGFGAYHALTGIMALPAGLVFGAVYQTRGGPWALAASAAGMLVATAVWLAAAPSTNEGIRMKVVSAGGAVLLLALALGRGASAQVQIRVAEPGRSTYSELHEGSFPAPRSPNRRWSCCGSAAPHRCCSG
jgi:MFS family permease